MAVTAAGFKELFPEFTAVADSRVGSFLAQAENRTDSTIFGNLADTAIYYLTAHLLAVAALTSGGGTGGAGPVTAEKVGDVSVSYGSIAEQQTASAGNFGSTSYGREYLAMRKERVIPVSVSGLRENL